MKIFCNADYHLFSAFVSSKNHGEKEIYNKNRACSGDVQTFFLVIP